MDFIKAIIFGAVQGVTEFLPVSSSGHLVILHEFFSFSNVDELAFDVMLHFATFLATLFFFRREAWSLLLAWLKSLRGEKSENGRLAWLIILGSLPAVIFALLFDDWIETTWRSPYIVILMLILIGALFLVIEKYGRQIIGIKEINWRKSVLIGFGQALALIPGTSRSGITIIAGMSADLKREEAVRFSFLLSLPIVFGAAIKKAPDIIGANLGLHSWLVLGLAFFSALFFGIITIKYLLIFVKNHRLSFFAYYRFLLAGALLLYFLL